MAATVCHRQESKKKGHLRIKPTGPDGSLDDSGEKRDQFLHNKANFELIFLLFTTSPNPVLPLSLRLPPFRNPIQIKRRTNQRQMTERLRGVAELLT